MSRRWWFIALSVWPGLPQIWLGEEGIGLGLGLLFALIANLTIALRLIWTEAADPAWGHFLASALVATWCLGLAYTVWWLWRCHPERFKRTIDEQYRESIDLYLQGHWNESRRRLEGVLAMDESDADAWLQMGCLLIRIDRPDEARQALHRCRGVDERGKWRWEVQQLLERIATRSVD